MEIEIKRTAKRDDYTIGSLSINGRKVCNTLEPHCIDWKTEKKTDGKTAIPEGRYRVEMHYSRKFGKQVPFLLDVPHFEGIMIHQGNAPQNTQGCILVGYNTIRGLVLKSHEAMVKIEDAIKYARKVKQEIWCMIG
jgi:hypothetical protein